jgi:hypothetical protein
MSDAIEPPNELTPGEGEAEPITIIEIDSDSDD